MVCAFCKKAFHFIGVHFFTFQAIFFQAQTTPCLWFICAHIWQGSSFTAFTVQPSWTFALNFLVRGVTKHHHILCPLNHPLPLKGVRSPRPPKAESPSSPQGSKRRTLSPSRPPPKGSLSLTPPNQSGSDSPSTSCFMRNWFSLPFKVWCLGKYSKESSLNLCCFAGVCAWSWRYIFMCRFQGREATKSPAPPFGFAPSLRIGRLPPAKKWRKPNQIGERIQLLKLLAPGH